jgi:hypothetical protein
MGDVQRSVAHQRRPSGTPNTIRAISDWHACLLLACSAVGCLAGVITPTFWINWTGLPWAGAVALTCLLVPLAASVILAGLTRQLASGLMLLVGAVGVSVALLAFSWLSVGPSALVGVWLLGAGLLSWPNRRSRRVVVRVGVVVLVAGLGQLLMWWVTPWAQEAAAVVLNVVIVGFLSRQAVRSAPALPRTSG